MNKTEKTDFLYIDILRIGACSAVILMHCTGRVFFPDNSRDWWVSMFLQAVAHWAVPTFFMITGITLLGYRERYSTEIFFKRRLLKVLIPFMAWSCIYLAWNVYLGGIELGTLKEFINLFTDNGIQGIFWYFYATIGIYLCIPVLSVFIRNSSQKMQYYFLLLWLLQVLIFPWLGRFAGIFVDQSGSGLQIGVATGYIGYTVLGYVLHQSKLSAKIRYLIYAAGIAGVVGMMAGTYYVNQNTEAFDDVFMAYMSLTCITISIAVLVFAKQIPWERWIIKGNKPYRLIKKLAGASMGVYLVHMFVVNTFEIFQVDTLSLRFMTLGTVAVFFISCLITIIGQKIPVLKNIF